MLFLLLYFLLGFIWIPLPTEAASLMLIKAYVKLGEDIPWGFFALCASCSSLGGMAIFWMGKYSHHLKVVDQMREKIFQKQKKVVLMIEKYGIYAVHLSAFTYIPFPLMCFLAGWWGLPFRQVFFATLWRIPRILISLKLILTAGKFL